MTVFYIDCFLFFSVHLENITNNTQGDENKQKDKHLIKIHNIIKKNNVKLNKHVFEMYRKMYKIIKQINKYIFFKCNHI